jgi:hypothetical protein
MIIYCVYLQVFSESYTPLKELVKASCNIPVAGCHAEDLEDLISVLDLHVDRIMQIGMFAMACSRDERRMYSAPLHSESTSCVEWPLLGCDAVWLLL